MSEVLLSNTAMRAIDAAVFEKKLYTEAQLVEQVARGIFDCLVQKGIVDKYCNSTIFLVGSGNNGSDALALARLFAACGKSIELVYVADAKKNSLNHSLRTALQGAGIPAWVAAHKETIEKKIHAASCIVDGCIGIGGSRALSGTCREVVHAANASAAFRVAIDVPSGAWMAANREAPMFHADLTVSIGMNKLLLYKPYVRKHCGIITVVWVPFLSSEHRFPWDKTRLHATEHSSAASSKVISPMLQPHALVARDTAAVRRFDREDIPKLLQLPEESSHKNTRASVLVCAGSTLMPGAAQLCTHAALSAYAGSVHLYVDNGDTDTASQKGRSIAPWQQLIISRHPSVLLSNDCTRPYTAIVIGPGWGRGRAKLFSKLIDQDTVLVLDADAFAYCVSQQDVIQRRTSPVIMTPHPKECASLLNTTTDEILTKPIESAQNLSRQYNAVVLLKGHVTYIVYQEMTALIDGMCPVLACAGSGDVLAGIIAGFAGLEEDTFSRVIAAALSHLAVGQHFYKKKIFPDASVFAESIPEILAQSMHAKLD